MSNLPVSFDEQGLVPVVVQDDATNEVLMLAFMNSEALNRTRETSRMHYWSRSRQSLWRKGETSGHEQIVKSIHLNCYNNSLLIRVDQIGACCHTGYPTCYYRELNDDGELISRGSRLFDPLDVYKAEESLIGDLTLWIGAYRWLSEHDLEMVSGTSRLLHESDPAYLATRIADELRELAGVLTGEHRHVSVEEDLVLESSQVLYWTALTAIRSGLSDAEIASLVDQGMLSGTASPSIHLTGRIRDLAFQWSHDLSDLGSLVLLTAGVISAAAVAAGQSGNRVVTIDLDELRTRPYLTSYFAGTG